MRSSEVLSAWGYESQIGCIIRHDTSLLEEISIEDAKQFVDISGEFGKSCSIFVNTRNGTSLQRAKLRSISKLMPENLRLCLVKNSNHIKINVSGNGNTVFIGHFGRAFNTDIIVSNNSSVLVGDDASCNHARIIMDNSEVRLGYDSMLSDEIILQSSDQHGIVDLSCMAITNNRARMIDIGRHVWLGRRCLVMPDCRIGDGAIIGAGAVVTSDIEACAIAVGVPARVVKRAVSWSRDPARIMPAEAELLRGLTVPGL